MQFAAFYSGQSQGIAHSGDPFFHFRLFLY